MIPISLLLILVAVALLALGLTGGSSTLLIGSIVASLLAAVALVVGARRGVGIRRAKPAAPADQPTAEMSAVADEPRYDEPAGYREPVYMDEPAFAADRGYSDDPVVADEPRYAEEPEFAASAGLDDRMSDDRDSQVRPDLSHESAFVAGETQPMPAVEDVDSPPSAWPPAAESADRDNLDIPLDEDYDRASSAINAARSAAPDENAWRRDPAAAGSAPSGSAAGFDAAGSGPGFDAAGSVPGFDAAGRDSGARFDDDFAEPDADDPDDEPLPQAVRPADAVRVARLDAEVLVVDGRPRYHMADCAHLVGRLTEPIGVNEAVELGFSPCGLCRPVDRLVAAAARN